VLKIKNTGAKFPLDRKFDKLVNGKSLTVSKRGRTMDEMHGGNAVQPSSILYKETK
jgi:hypothetical protein